MDRTIYSVQTQYPKPYMTFPDYVSYVNRIDTMMKKNQTFLDESMPRNDVPYARYNDQDPGPSSLCIMYNYMQPALPYVKPVCLRSPQYQYWYTSQ